MKSVIRREVCSSLPRLSILANYSAAQVPQSEPEREMNLPTLLNATPVKEDPQDDELRRLLKARHNEAVGEVQAVFVMRQADPAREQVPEEFTSSEWWSDKTP